MVIDDYSKAHNQPPSPSPGPAKAPDIHAPLREYQIQVKFETRINR